MTELIGMIAGLAAIGLFAASGAWMVITGKDCDGMIPELG